jgi:hypothetical protein
VRLAGEERLRDGRAKTFQSLQFPRQSIRAIASKQTSLGPLRFTASFHLRDPRAKLLATQKKTRKVSSYPLEAQDLRRKCRQVEWTDGRHQVQPPFPRFSSLCLSLARPTFVHRASVITLPALVVFLGASSGSPRKNLAIPLIGPRPLCPLHPLLTKPAGWSAPTQSHSHYYTRYHALSDKRLSSIFHQADPAWSSRPLFFPSLPSMTNASLPIQPS